MNPEHRQGSAEQAMTYFTEQVGTVEMTNLVTALLTNVYNFRMTGASPARAVQVAVMKNGRTLYLTGEIR